MLGAHLLRWVKANSLILGLLALAEVIFLTEWVWKPPFLAGRVPGLYWLFVAIDRIVLPFTGIALVGALSALIVALIFLAQKQTFGWQALGVGGALLVAGLAAGSTFLMIFAQNTIHMDRVRVRHHIYYLAGYPMFDTNYRLFECDVVGLFCMSRYTSGDLLGPAAWPGTLSYASETNTLSIIADEEGVIFTYSPP